MSPFQICSVHQVLPVALKLLFFPHTNETTAKSNFGLTNLLAGGWSDSDSPTQAEKSFHLLCICMKCSQMWSNTQWTEEKISSRGKIMKLIKTGRTMNSLPPWRYPNNLRTLLEKWTSCSENRKEQQDINQIKISWDCALENHTACTEICSCSSLQSWLTPGILRDTKTPMCPEPLQVLLARAQGGHLIKKWILTGEKEISHTLYFTRNSNGISTWIWDETQHQERYCGTFAVLRLQKPFVSMRFKGTQNGLQSDEQ